METYFDEAGLSSRVIAKRKKVVDLINLYEQYPILWLRSHPEFSNQIKKERNWDKLLLKYKDQHPDERFTTKDEIKKHIRYLRTYFIKERKRVDSINQMTEGGDDIETPAQSVYYFNQFKFLDKNNERSTKTEPTLEEIEDEYDENSFQAKKMTPREKLTETRLDNNSCFEDDSDVSFGSYVVAGLKEMNPEQNLLVKDFMASLIRLGKTNQFSQNMSILLKPAETSFFIVENNN